MGSSPSLASAPVGENPPLKRTLCSSIQGKLWFFTIAYTQGLEHPQVQQSACLKITRTRPLPHQRLDKAWHPYFSFPSFLPHGSLYLGELWHGFGHLAGPSCGSGEPARFYPSINLSFIFPFSYIYFTWSLPFSTKRTQRSLQCSPVHFILTRTSEVG